MVLWQVVGGNKDGIIVREGEALSSAQHPDRLATGSNVAEIELVGGRLHYRLVDGCGVGPGEGWVSINVNGRALLHRKAEVLLSPAPEPAPDLERSSHRVRTAVNIHEWQPEGDAGGAEFGFLLGLIGEDKDREKVLKFRAFDDQKRALVARLLMRNASMMALGHQNFSELSIARTKGQKPFLACPLPPEGEAPNWNANISHEGEWVVCASEPLCVVGVDVAHLRRFGPKGKPMDFRTTFKDQLTEAEWDEVTSAGDDLDDQYEIFSRFWSAKESFVKARGDGIAFPLGTTKFSWTPLPGYSDRTAYRGIVAVDGESKPLWTFTQYKMPGEQAHWTTVARGPLTDIVDANGDFKRTLRRPQTKFSDDEWSEVLQADNPPFDVVRVGALVPAGDREAYMKARGVAA